MNILHVVTAINRGGAEGQVVDLARAQAARGAVVSVAYLKGDSYWSAALRDAGVSVVHLGLSRYGDPRPVFRLRRVINRLLPDIIHAHLPPGELYTRLALIGYGRRIPLVITRHNDERFHRHVGHRSMARWVAARASRIIAISDAVKRHSVSYLGLPLASVTTIRYGFDAQSYLTPRPEARARLRAEWSVADDMLVIGTIARLVPQKAVHVLLESYARYQRGGGQSRLVVVGRGPLESQLKQLATELNLNVIWTGFREDIPEIMQAFDVFALTSEYEGFGLVLLEAMASGRPVVATAVSAIPEVVIPEAAVLCAAGDVDALSAAFAELEDEGKRRLMGVEGRRHATSAFPCEAMIEATLGVYADCLRERPGFQAQSASQDHAAARLRRGAPK